MPTQFKIPFCIGFFLLCLQIGFSQESEEDIRFWRKKAKNYVKDPLSLRADLKSYQVLWQNQKSSLRRCPPTPPAPSDVLDSLRWANIQMEVALDESQKRNRFLEQQVDSLKLRIETLEQSSNKD